LYRENDRTPQQREEHERSQILHAAELPATFVSLSQSMNRNALIIILMRADTSFSTGSTKEVNSEDAIAIGDVQYVESHSYSGKSIWRCICAHAATQGK